jgi:hypothetical protein
MNLLDNSLHFGEGRAESKARIYLSETGSSRAFMHMHSGAGRRIQAVDYPQLGVDLSSTFRGELTAPVPASEIPHYRCPHDNMVRAFQDRSHRFSSDPRLRCYIQVIL